MFSLTLSDFVCSDFDSQAGSSNYPKRDCPAENEAWAKFPSVETAPCCSNYTLAIGSLLLMAEYAMQLDNRASAGVLRGYGGGDGRRVH